MNFETFAQNEAVPQEEKPGESKNQKENPERNERYEQSIVLAAIRSGNIDLAYEKREIVAKNFLESEKVQEATKEGILLCAKQGDLDRVLHLESFLNDSEKEEFFQSVDSQEAAQEGIIKQINRNLPVWTDIHLFGEKFNIMASPEVQQALQEKYIRCAREGSTAEAIGVQERFGLTNGFLNSDEAQKAVKEGIMLWIKQGNTEAAIGSREMYGLPDSYFDSKDIQPAIQEGFLSLIKEGNIDKLFAFANALNISDDIFYSKDSKRTAEEFILKKLQSSNETDLDLSTIDSMAQALDIEGDLKTAFFKQYASRWFAKFKGRDPEKAEILKDLFNLPERG